jgi:Sigma-70 factor, region 1.2
VRRTFRSPNEALDTVREIGMIPLLTAAQEVDLAMRIEAGELATELLAEDRSPG